MSTHEFMRLLRRGWWMIVGGFVLGVAGAGIYAWQQRQVYEGTVTTYIHPSAAVRGAGPAAVSSDVSLLSYGSLVNTVVSIAESKSALASATSALGIQRGRLDGYSAVATLRPKSFIMDLSVDGPDRRLVVPIVNRLFQEISSTVTIRYPIAAVSVLDTASSSSQIQPRVKRDLVYGALAGLIIGFVLASLWTSSSFRANRKGPPDRAERPVEPPQAEPELST